MGYWQQRAPCANFNDNSDSDECKRPALFMRSSQNQIATSDRVMQAPRIFIGYLMMQILTATFWPVLNSSTLKNRRFDPFRFLKKLFVIFFAWTKNLDLSWVNTGLDKALQPGYNWFISIQTDCWKFQVHHDPKSRLRTLFVLQFVR